MKKQILFLLGGALILSACSESSDNKGPKVNIMAKPANPAPMSYLSEVISTLQNSGSYLPSEEALFDKVVDGTDVKYVGGTSEQRTAISKLNSTGREFIEKIKSTCTLKDANVFESGTPAKGATVIKKASMSSSGKNCAYEIDRGAISSMYIAQLSGNERTGTGNAAIIMDQSNYNRRTIKDSRLAQASGIVEFSFKFNINLNFNVTIANGKTSGPVNGPVTGSIQLKLANGETIQGPIEGYMSGILENGETKNSEFAMFFKGSSSKGDIWFGVQVRDGKTTEIYLNGEKMNPNDMKDGNIFGVDKKMIQVIQ